MAKKRKTVTYRAAGGIVMDDEGRVLLLERFVTRKGREIREIRLPKGHIEPGETPEQAALREVCEESGYCDLEIVADLGEGHVSFDYGKKHVERDEHYFLMRLLHARRQSSQPHDEHSEESLFFPLWAASLEEAERLLTYEAEKAFIRRARALKTRGKTHTDHIDPS